MPKLLLRRPSDAAARGNLRTAGGVQYAERAGACDRDRRIEAGYRRMECYTPYPVEEAAVALRFHKNRVPLVCLLGGLMGVTTAFLMETWIAVWAYPLNIAGRPLFSWPAFIIPAYEWTILFAGLSAAFGMIALNGLPQLYHPLFNAPNFREWRDDGQVLSVPGGARPEVFADRDAGVSGAVSRRSPWWR